METLEALFAQQRYDGIVNFIHYPRAEEYPPIHRLLVKNTDHLIFLSSYRVYADEQHPITEEAPQLLDTAADKVFLQQEDYALAKSRAERFIRSEPDVPNWTIVRPVISFSERRLDIVTRSGREILEKAKSGEPLLLPLATKELTAGLDWAGNSGKLIANLLFKPETFGQAYTVTSAPGLTWGQVAEIYTRLVGVRFDWVDTGTYMEHYGIQGAAQWILTYDRLFDRAVDNSKILRDTGLTRADFATVEEGIRAELARIEQGE
jgi:nucleoside-diphosphate-sugar epimerase